MHRSLVCISIIAGLLAGSRRATAASDFTMPDAWRAPGAELPGAGVEIDLGSALGWFDLSKPASQRHHGPGGAPQVDGARLTLHRWDATVQLADRLDAVRFALDYTLQGEAQGRLNSLPLLAPWYPKFQPCYVLSRTDAAGDSSVMLMQADEGVDLRQPGDHRVTYAPQALRALDHDAGVVQLGHVVDPAPAGVYQVESHDAWRVDRNGAEPLTMASWQDSLLTGNLLLDHPALAAGLTFTIADLSDYQLQLRGAIVPSASGDRQAAVARLTVRDAQGRELPIAGAKVTLVRADGQRIALAPMHQVRYLPRGMYAAWLDTPVDPRTATLEAQLTVARQGEAPAAQAVQGQWTDAASAGLAAASPLRLLPPAAPAPKCSGMWVYCIYDPAHVAPERLDKMVEQAHQLGLSELYLNAYAGKSTYLQRPATDLTPALAPDDPAAKYVTFHDDWVRRVLDAAHARGLRVYLAFNVGSGPERMVSPEAHPNFFMQDPQGQLLPKVANIADPQFQAWITAMIRHQVERYPDLDGVTLDYIRFQKADFSPQGRQRYHDATGRDLDDDWRNLCDDWDGRVVGHPIGAYHEQVLTDLVESIEQACLDANPKLKFAMYPINPTVSGQAWNGQCGPSWTNRGLIDHMLISCYHPIYGQMLWTMACYTAQTDESWRAVPMVSFGDGRVPVPAEAIVRQLAWLHDMGFDNVSYYAWQNAPAHQQAFVRLLDELSQKAD